MPNGIYIQTEYHGKLIRKIVCNGEERWFIGSDCAVTFLTMDDCMAAIRRTSPRLIRPGQPATNGAAHNFCVCFRL